MLGSCRTHGRDWSRHICGRWAGFRESIWLCGNVLDRPECLVDVSYRLGVVDGVSAQHPER
jgi:hypothetical protein